MIVKNPDKVSEKITRHRPGSGLHISHLAVSFGQAKEPSPLEFKQSSGQDRSRASKND